MATALTTMVTRVGYLLGITPSASTLPTSTEITQWIKDAESQLLQRLPPRFLLARVVRQTTGVSLSSPYNVADYSAVDMSRLLSAALYDSSATTYYQCYVIHSINDFNNLRLVDTADPLYNFIIARDPADLKLYIHPAGASGDILYASYILNIDYTSTDYLLDVATEPLATYYAAAIASMQQADYLQQANKFLAMYELGIKALGGI